MSDIARCLAEQRECRDYILEHRGDDTDGAWLGMSDWVTEEVLVRAESFKHDELHGEDIRSLRGVFR